MTVNNNPGVSSRNLAQHQNDFSKGEIFQANGCLRNLKYLTHFVDYDQIFCPKQYLEKIGRQNWQTKEVDKIRTTLCAKSAFCTLNNVEAEAAETAESLQDLNLRFEIKAYNLNSRIVTNLGSFWAVMLLLGVLPRIIMDKNIYVCTKKLTLKQ